jgi:hypothetical protein
MSQKFCCGNEEHMKEYMKHRDPSEMTPLPFAHEKWCALHFDIEDIGGGGGVANTKEEEMKMDKHTNPEMAIDPGLIHSGSCTPGCSCYQKLYHCRHWVEYEAPECKCKTHLAEKKKQENSENEEKK